MSEEKVLFEDAKFIITDLRLNFNNYFIPIDQIKEIKVRLRVFSLTLSFSLFLISFSSFVVLPEYYLLIIGVFFIWLSYSFINYVELWITDTNGKREKITTTSLTEATYLYKIDETIKLAIEENRRRRDEDKDFDYTETMKYRQKLREIENKDD